MAGNLRHPKNPLVVIFGSTGTGKSDLAVAIAQRFNGEVVNADAMQMYQGLPIITNKISTEERKGIQHHLLDIVGLDEEPWFVGRFKEEATRIIHEIRSRGKLPIVVGGTHYYIESLLFEDKLVSQGHSNQEPAQEDSGEENDDPILHAPVEDMLERLRQVDPVMADRWHPNDARKIRRSLEIFLNTGRRASDIYAEQEIRKQAARGRGVDDSSASPCNALLLWVHSDRQTLIKRLDNRINVMLERGLLTETDQLHQYLQNQASAGNKIDLSKGIWQSIGYPQFEPYRQACAASSESAELDKVKRQCVENMKTATRRYAQYQVKWIMKKLMPPLREEGRFEKLYLLDSTDVASFQANVLDKAAELTRHFLSGEPMPPAKGVSEAAHEVLTIAESGGQKDTPCRRVCQTCNMTLVTEEGWQRHIKGTSHRRVLKAMDKTARRSRPGRPRADFSGAGSEAEPPSSREELAPKHSL